MADACATRATVVEPDVAQEVLDGFVLQQAFDIQLESKGRDEAKMEFIDDKGSTTEGGNERGVRRAAIGMVTVLRSPGGSVGSRWRSYRGLRG